MEKKLYLRGKARIRNGLKFGSILAFQSSTTGFHEIEHDENVAQWDDYRRDLPAGQAGIPSRYLGTIYDR